MKLADAYTLACQVLEVIAPYCEQAVIAGSIRRGNKPNVKDIEIVAIPQPLRTQMTLGESPVADELDFFLRQLETNGEITRHTGADPRKWCWGPRHKKFLLASGSGWQPIQVDMYIVKPPAQWGAIFALRTGPAEFNQAIMSKVLPRRNLCHEDGRLVTADGTPLPTSTERDYFTMLGLPYLRPSERTAEVIDRCIQVGLVQPYEHTGSARPVQANLL
ncbi:hypothetical protein ACFLYO_11960 [Chloroflexota bacterium]